MTILLYKNGQWLIDGEQPLEGVSLDNLAAILSNPKDGDVVKYDESSGMWVAGEPGSYLPPVTSADNGKVLAVENGEWVAGEVSSLPPITSSDNGKVLTVEELKSKGAVIVPEQSITTTYGHPVECVGADASLFVVGTHVISTLNGTEYEGTVMLSQAGYKYVSAGSGTSYQLDEQTNKITFYGYNATYVCSLHVEDISVEWEAQEKAFLPDVTTSDDGKLLQVDRNASAGDVIVPQQSVSVTTEEKTFNNADATLFSNGTVVIVRISAGPQYTRTATVLNGAVNVMGANGKSLTISKNGDDITYVGSEDFNATITVSKAVFAPEFKLVKPSESDEFIVRIEDANGSVNLEQDYNDIYRAYSSGKRIVLNYTKSGYSTYIAKVNCADMRYSGSPFRNFIGENILILADGSVNIYKCTVKPDNTCTVDTYEFTITPAS